MAATTSLTIGQNAPDFEIPDQDGNIVSLSQFKGKKVVLYFYPKDSTPGCTAQACNLRDHHETFLSQGYVILGVSTDTEKKHQNFIKKNDLPFTLLADTERKAHEAYDVWQLKKFMGREFMGTIRTTFVIDENGIIKDIIAKVKTKEHAAQILEA